MIKGVSPKTPEFQSEFRNIENSGIVLKADRLDDYFDELDDYFDEPIHRREEEVRTHDKHHKYR